ncbi:uncharacterized protein LOC132262897 [Phlebotomus argentipes]|uniref:uncharacterized protein LOC132262897 n=1 Tax=Phlebotomus argentipes TaxID=94469 RepID=UPI002892DC40|nr:uncharacterized protein LOC132262897 [Phlebotomus argentipes]
MDNSVKFLWLAAIKLPNSSPGMQLLKAHYAAKSVALAEKGCDLPENFRSVSTMCPKCSNLWSSGALHLALKSSRKRRTRFRRFVMKYYRSKKNTKQRRLARKLMMRAFNSVEFTCRVCKGVTKVPLMRQSRKKSAAKKETKIVPEKTRPDVPLANPSKNKKKRKKDPFAGLNREAIVAAQKPQASVQKPSVGKLAAILKKSVSISSNKLDTMLK